MTLSWTTTDADYVIVAPGVGAVRGNERGVESHDDHDVHALCDEPISDAVLQR